MVLQETILCATSPPSAAAGLGSITVHDFQTGVSLASFKQTNAGSHSVAVLPSKNGQGGFILASQPDKSILNVYNFQKDQINLKIVLPEKLTCIAIDRTGDLCAAGTAAGRIHLWETASGILYNSWEAHYRKVNVLRFTNDGFALVSGSDDSGVIVWSVSRLLNDEVQNEPVLPFCSLSDHTLPVTGILCSIGVFPQCRVLTSSIDHSVKLWDLSTQTLLTTFQFPETISFIAWDITEKFFFAASASGSIYRTDLFKPKELKSGGTVMEAVGGAGVTDVLRFESDDPKGSSKKKLIAVGQPISSICLSLTSTMLLVGTAEGLIHIYDVPSHQRLRSITTHKGMTISHLETMLKPPDLIGHISLQVDPGAETKDIMPVKPVLPFQRMRDPKAREAHEVTIMLPPSTLVVHEKGSDYYSKEEMLADHAFFMQPLAKADKGQGDSTSLKTRIDELENEVEQLRQQLSKAKGVNDAMWDTVVQRLVYQAKDPTREEAKEPEAPEDDQPKRKRGRV